MVPVISDHSLSIWWFWLDANRSYEMSPQCLDHRTIPKRVELKLFSTIQLEDLLFLIGQFVFFARNKMSL